MSAAIHQFFKLTGATDTADEVDTFARAWIVNAEQGIE